MKRFGFRIVVGISISIASAASTHGQSKSPSIISTADGEVAIPKESGSLGQKDPGAMEELNNHISAMGAESSKAIKCVGTIIYGSRDTVPYEATLYIAGRDNFRLDALTKSGNISTRIHGKIGKFQDGATHISNMPLDGAMGGIFPFELPRLIHEKDPRVTVIDHGLTSTPGQKLHRISIERPTIGRNPVTHATEMFAIDFYFDPSTHYLVKSVSLGAVPGSGSHRFVFIVTYSDYKKVEQTMMPFHFVETMNGEVDRTFDVSNIEFDKVTEQAFFDF